MGNNNTKKNSNKIIMIIIIIVVRILIIITIITKRTPSKWASLPSRSLLNLDGAFQKSARTTEKSKRAKKRPQPEHP